MLYIECKGIPIRVRPCKSRSNAFVMLLLSDCGVWDVFITNDTFLYPFSFSIFSLQQHAIGFCSLLYHHSLQQSPLEKGKMNLLESQYLLSSLLYPGMDVTSLFPVVRDLLFSQIHPDTICIKLVCTLLILEGLWPSTLSDWKSFLGNTKYLEKDLSFLLHLNQIPVFDLPSLKDQTWNCSFWKKILIQILQEDRSFFQRK